MDPQQTELMPDIIGLIPAGGQGTRLGPLPCSKELYPIGVGAPRQGSGAGPKVVAHYLLEKMRAAGIHKAYIILRRGKWDIPSYFGDGAMLEMHLGYLIMGDPSGVPFTLDQAYSFVRHATVAFGFPDILFDSEDGFRKLLLRQAARGGDVTLGLFPANHPSKEDIVDFDENGQVRDIFLRPSDNPLRYSWAIAVWTPKFTEFLHQYVARERSTTVRDVELSAGHAVRAAIRAGLYVDSLVLSETPYLDIGTSDDLYRAIRRTVENPAP
jgi:glucose-1-phosphate thymidylyltransferase